MTFQQFIRFTNDAAALEKILRFLQSLSQILAAYSLTIEDAKLWIHLRRQFTTGTRFYFLVSIFPIAVWIRMIADLDYMREGRRYIRFFRWLDCFSKAYGCFYSMSAGGGGVSMIGILEVGKWSFMGGYLGLESVTILDQLDVWPTPWAEKCMFEANQFWFYSLVCSIILGAYSLYTSTQDPTTSGVGKGKDKRESEDEKVRKEKRRRVKTRLVADGFDLLIPGFVTGWIRTTPAVVGFASATSTVLSSKDIWDRMR